MVRHDGKVSDVSHMLVRLSPSAIRSQITTICSFVTFRFGIRAPSLDRHRLLDIGMKQLVRLRALKNQADGNHNVRQDDYLPGSQQKM